MSIWARIRNLWYGFLSLWVKGIEEDNAEAVYESAINERIRKHHELKKAVSGIVYLRNKLDQEEDAAIAELAQVNAEIPVAVESGEDEVALVLLQKKEELEARVTKLQADLAKVEKQAEEAKSGLVEFQAEIRKLQNEKEAKLAEKSTAEARIKIQETLSGLSVDADVKALDNVRTSIQKKVAEADVGSEIAENSIDAKLKKIRQQTGSVTAKAKLDELKKQMASRSAAAEGAQVQKTI